MFKKGQKVKFKPTRKDWKIDYSADGVQPGDVGVVAYEAAFVGDDVIVDFVRTDGTTSNGFFAFEEDLEAVE